MIVMSKLDEVAYNYALKLFFFMKNDLISA